MTAFATVVAAVARVTRVRRRFASKIKADCPVCGRKTRLEVVQFSSGAVGIVCQAGCDREAVRERIGLGWREFFDDVPYRPAPRRSAAQHVLHAVSGLRWTIVTHAFAEEDRDLGLAVEIVERLLPARHRVRDLLRLERHSNRVARVSAHGGLRDATGNSASGQGRGASCTTADSPARRARADRAAGRATRSDDRAWPEVRAHLPTRDSDDALVGQAAPRSCGSYGSSRFAWV